jgi:predicted O-methyltransferase YrrM
MGQAMLVDTLIQDKPPFHLHQGALTNSWSVHPDTLRYIYSLVSPGSVTLETGCGQTTVVFAMAGAKHTCVMPNAGEAERVKAYCANLGLACEITFVIESSDVALPCGDQIPPELDFVFIDGAHAFPAPIIDWHYTARRLKIGGVLGVDDYRMPSVQLLHQFLCDEDEWELLTIMQNTSFFKKLQEPKALVHWNGQKINASYPGY